MGEGSKSGLRIQESLKRYYGGCLFCSKARYEGLECHRVIPGEEGGKYHRANVVVLCSYCHSLVTAGVIRTHAIRTGSTSLHVLHYTDEAGVERYEPMRPRREVA